MPLVIGLTGSIAAGKSTVAQILVDNGAVHCDADKLVHRLYDPGTPGFEKVVAHFGEDVVGPDGYIDRKILGAKVFGKPAEMAALTRAMGNISEAIQKEIDGWRATLGPDDLAVMEAVNLLEPGYCMWCDQVWLIGVDDDIAKQRLVETRGMTESEAEQRIKAMVPLAVRAPGADFVHKNNGTPDELRATIQAEIDRIRELHKEGTLPEAVSHTWWPKFAEERKAAMEKAAAEKAAAEEAAKKAEAGA